MSNALIVSSIPNSAVYLKSALEECGISSISTAEDAASAGAQWGESDFSIFVINSPLGDGSGVELAREISENSAGVVILIVKGEQLAAAEKAVHGSGVILIPKPINRLLFISAIDIAKAIYQKLALFQQERLELQQKNSELKLINQAKLMLISEKGLTEAEAHRFLEKQAMERREPKLRIAEIVIKEYQ